MGQWNIWNQRDNTVKASTLNGWKPLLLQDFRTQLSEILHQQSLKQMSPASLNNKKSVLLYKNYSVTHPTGKICKSSQFSSYKLLPIKPRVWCMGSTNTKQFRLKELKIMFLEGPWQHGFSLMTDTILIIIPCFPRKFKQKLCKSIASVI